MYEKRSSCPSDEVETSSKKKYKQQTLFKSDAVIDPSVDEASGQDLWKKVGFTKKLSKASVKYYHGCDN